jgi:2,4-dienoyl-CoA reductase-like NADH-dependent reductase (Old Yellow Enzyme family)
VRLPLILAGNLGDPHQANRAITEGHADFAAIGRAMMNDPLWTTTARQSLKPK